MRTKAKHTPLDWKVTRWHAEHFADGFETVVTDSRGHGLFIATSKGHTGKSQANAELVVRAVNSHDELVEALRLLIENRKQHGHREIPSTTAALAKARGE